MIKEHWASYGTSFQKAVLSRDNPQNGIAEPQVYQCKSKKKCCKKFKRGKQCGSCPKMKMMIELMEKAHFHC